MEKELFFEKVDQLKKEMETDTQAAIANYEKRLLPELVNDFYEILNNVKRDGGNELISFVKKSDFTEAPASTRFHSAFRGGLLLHSLIVYYSFLQLKESAPWDKILNMNDESIILITLCHDLCKTYFYGTELRNKKVYKDNGSKKDSMGRYDWETILAFTCDDKYPLGHGEKSVIFLQQFVHLSMSEIMCIRWHMGFSDSDGQHSYLSKAFRLHPEVLALHEADMRATYLWEFSEN